jgi:hypothetical protein
MRRLPIKGEVLVQPGTAVGPDTVVARALLPGALQTLKLSEKLSVEPREVPLYFQLSAGDPIAKGDVVAETKGFFGHFKTKVTSDYTGTVETVSEVTGNALIREAGIPVDVLAYIEGVVAEVIPDEGAIVETRGAMVQGIFGVGGERYGEIAVVVAGPDEVLNADKIHEEHRGKILIAGAGVTYDAIVKASEHGVIGIVSGGLRDSDLTQFLGYDIGVAITGQELIGLTLVVTEGFGFLSMAHRTFELFQSLQGRKASINGATQIRAGVIRPEVIAPHTGSVPPEQSPEGAFELKPGASIRVIREPYFGRIGTVTELPAALMVVDSGTEVRVLKATLDGNQDVVVPRANVEIIAT